MGRIGGVGQEESWGGEGQVVGRTVGRQWEAGLGPSTRSKSKSSSLAACHNPVLLGSVPLKMGKVSLCSEKPDAAAAGPNMHQI